MLDLQLRREYFRQRVFTDVGAGLLLVAVVVFLLSVRTAATLRRQMPSPTVPLGSQDREAAWTRIARWAVAVLCVVMVGAAVMLAFSVKSPLPEIARNWPHSEFVASDWNSNVPIAIGR